MKKRISLLAGAALAVALLMPCGTALHAQSQSQPGQQPNAQQQPEQPTTRIYVGQVVKAKNGQFGLLINKETGAGYYLDDQDRAKQFEGKNVKVVGVLDIHSGTIHISDIQAA